MQIPWQWLTQDTYETMCSQRAPHSSPSHVSYGVYSESILEENGAITNNSNCTSTAPCIYLFIITILSSDFQRIILPNSWRSQMDPMLAPWTLLSGYIQQSLYIITTACCLPLFVFSTCSPCHWQFSILFHFFWDKSFTKSSSHLHALCWKAWGVKAYKILLLYIFNACWKAVTSAKY